MPAQGNNAYIFPGVALGLIASEAKRVPNDIFLIAAETVANVMQTKYNDLLRFGVIYPPISAIRDVSIEIAVSIADEIHSRKLTDQTKTDDFRKLVGDIRYKL